MKRDWLLRTIRRKRSVASWSAIVVVAVGLAVIGHFVSYGFQRFTTLKVVDDGLVEGAFNDEGYFVVGVSALVDDAEMDYRAKAEFAIRDFAGWHDEGPEKLLCNEPVSGTLGVNVFRVRTELELADVTCSGGHVYIKFERSPSGGSTSSHEVRIWTKIDLPIEVTERLELDLIEGIKSAQKSFSFSQRDYEIVNVPVSDFPLEDTAVEMREISSEALAVKMIFFNDESFFLFDPENQFFLFYAHSNKN